MQFLHKSPCEISSVIVKHLNQSKGTTSDEFEPHNTDASFDLFYTNQASTVVNRMLLV
jgi:hypothetical protein